MAMGGMLGMCRDGCLHPARVGCMKQGGRRIGNCRHQWVVKKVHMEIPASVLAAVFVHECTQFLKAADWVRLTWIAHTNNIIRNIIQFMHD